MLKRILIPLDGTDYARSAVAKGIRMAKNTGASLAGLVVVDEPGITHPEMVPAGAYEYLEQKHKTLLEQAHAKAGDCLERFHDTCKQEGVEAYSLTRVGTPWEVVVQESHQHDLVVMGQETCFCHESTPKKPCITLDNVLKHCVRPIIAVPQKLPAVGKGILMATDGSDTFSRTLQIYQLMGLAGRRTVRVVSVDKKMEVAQKNCEEVAGYLGAHNIKTELHPVESSEAPRDFLLNLVENEPPEILVIGSHGHSAIREFLFGSVAETLVPKSPVPVFIYH